MKKTVKGFVDSEGNEYQYKDEIARSQNQNLEEEINSNKTYMDKVKTELKNDNKTLNGRIDTILTGTVNTTKLVTVHSATIRNNSASDLTFKISSKDNETLKSIKDKSPTVINANVIAKALDGVAINGKGIPSSYNVESTNDEYVITVYSGSSSVVGQYVFMAVVTIAYEEIATDISSAELKDVRAGADGTVYKSAGEAVRQQIGSLKSDTSRIKKSLKTTYVDMNLFALGTINKDTGEEESSNKILRSIIDVNATEDITIKLPKGYQWNVAHWLAGEYRSDLWNENDWNQNLTIAKTTMNYKYRILIRRSDGADITLSELIGVAETNREDLQSFDKIDDLNTKVDANTTSISELKESLGNQEVYSEGLKKSAVLNDAIIETLYTGLAKNAPDTINKMYNSKNNHWQQFDSNFLGIVYEVKEGEQYVISGTSLNERFQLVNFFDTLETDRVLDFYPKVSDTYSGLKVVMELLTVPKNANYMLLNTHQDSTITVEKVTGYKDFKSETEKILADLEKTSIDVTEKTSELDQSCVKNEIMTDSVYNGRAGDNQNILNKMCVLESDHWQTFDTDYCGVSYSVAEGEQYRITGTNINSSFSLINLFNSMEEVKGIQYYPSKDMVDADKKHYTGLKIQDYVVKIPPGCVRMVLNSHRSSTIKIEKITGYKDFKSETEKTLTDLNNSDDLKDFQIKNLQQRLFDTGKYNDFAFKEFDKTYFAFVIDDSNKTLYPIYKIFHDKGVKLSSATIPGNLNIAVEGIGTNKDVLDLIVADGGEVLVHYYGNLIDIGEQAPDTDRTYLNTVEDWDSRIVVTKKALEDMGYKIRGVIRADYTSSRTKTGEQYCREYYDYSDGLGTSPQYTLTRMFVHNFSTVEDFKKWIDKCCEKPGFYPICTHGSESVNDNMDEILDYILNKDNCECTTYKDVYDQFRSTVLENRIKALEEKVSG